MRGKRLTAAGMLSLWAVLAAATPAALAQEGGESGDSSPQELAREGAERLMNALDGLLRMIPQYGVPEIQDNGDILIPRLNPEGGETPQGEGEDDSGSEDGKNGENGDLDSREI